MKKKFMKFSAIALLSIGLVACNDENSNEATVEPTGHVVEVTITATDFAFDQTEIHVNQGDTVRMTLTNKEGHHTIEIEGHGTVEPAETIEFVADKKGEIDFWCAFPCGEGHTKMTGKIHVM